MKRPSASKTNLLLACPAHLALPHEEQRPGKPALDGTRRHATAQGYVEKKLPPPPEDRQWLEGVREHLDTLEGYAAEMAFSFDPLWGVARLVGKDIGRDYGNLQPTEIPGTADYLHAASSHVITVVDLKTGRGAVEPARSNPQLLTLALAASRWFDEPTVRVGLLLAPEGVEPRWDWHTHDEAALVEHEARLARAMTEALEADEAWQAGREVPHLRPSTLCGYCPARASCPAANGQVQRAVVDQTVFRAAWQEARRAGEYGKLAAALTILEAEAEALKEALREDAKAKGPLDLGDGHTAAVRVTEREELDTAGVYAYLEQTYGADVARAAMSLSASKTSLEGAMRQLAAALKEQGQKATVKGLMAATMEALRQRGAVASKQVERFELGL